MRLHRKFVCDGQPLDVEVVVEGDGRARARVGDRTIDVEFSGLPEGGVRLVVDGIAHEAFVAAHGRAQQLRLDGTTYDLETARGRGASAAAGSGSVEAPMTGTVLDVLVAVGDTVTADSPVVVLSAMKMEHKLLAGIAGVVQEVNCRAGELVDQGRLLVRVASGAGS